MAVGYPPIPVYPNGIDSDTTLFLVYNTTEAALTEDNEPWAEEIAVLPRTNTQAEIWANNGFANINGELFYYDAVDKDVNGKVCNLKRCARNLGGNPTQFNAAGSMVRSFVVAEHHNQLVDAIILTEQFIGYNFTPDESTLDWRIRNLQAVPIIFDDFGCPDITFHFTVASTDPSSGTVVNYSLDIAGSFNEFTLSFGDGSSTSSIQEGTHTYAPNANIDPIVTFKNQNCQIVQTPMERDSVNAPQAESNPVSFSAPNSPVFIFPDINVAAPSIPETNITLPPFQFPCIDLSPLNISPLINIPSVIMVQPPINLPSVIDFEQVNIPSFIGIGDITLPSILNINVPDIELIVPTIPNISLIVPQISIPPLSVPSVVFPNINLIVPTIPNVSLIAPSLINISIGSLNVPNISLIAPTIPNISLITPTFPNISLITPTFPDISLIAPIIPNISLIVPNISVIVPNISVIVPNFPNISVIVPNFPNISVTIPTIPNISLNVPTIPNISLNVPTIPNIGITVPAFPNLGITVPAFPNLSLTVPAIPNLSLTVPAIPNIGITVPAFPNIGITVPAFPNIGITVPTFPAITVDWAPVPNINMNWGSPPTVPITWGSPPTVPLNWGSPPTVSVAWGTPPTVQVNVTVTCPSTPLALAAADPGMTDDMLGIGKDIEVQYDVSGFPSEIRVIPPDIPNVRMIHDLPSEITIKNPVFPDLKWEIPELKDIKILPPETQLTIEAIGIPDVIKLESEISIPDRIELYIPISIPDRIILDHDIPSIIRVEGLPDVIRLEHNLPSIIELKMPEKPEIELVYKGSPIPVQVQMDIQKLIADEDQACYAIIPCKGK